MKKKLFSTVVATIIAVIALSVSTEFESLAKEPICQSEDDRSERPDEMAPRDHSIPDSRDPIAIGPRNASSADDSSIDCPPDYEEDEARRIRTQEGDVVDLVDRSKRVPKYSIIYGDATIAFDSFGVGIIPDSVKSKEGEVFFWRDGGGNVWRFNRVPDGPLLNDSGFHPGWFHKYYGENYNNMTWQEFFGAEKVGEAELTIGIPESMK